MATISTQQRESLANIPNSTARSRLRLLLGLPAPLRSFMLKEETTQTLASLLEDKHNLPIEQGSRVAKVMWLVVIGEIPLNQFISRLVSDAGLNAQVAQAVAQDINEQIFQPVREELMEVHGVDQNNGSITMNGDGTNSPAATQQQKEGAPSAAAEKMNNAEADRGTQTNQNTEQAEASARRKELLERLRQSQDETGAGEVASEKPIDTQPADSEQPPQEAAEPDSTQNNDTEPKATTASAPFGPAQDKSQIWNGKKIDLSKVPPRREIKKETGNGGKKDGERYIQLEKGPDGFYYEV